jgi:hypothetical protein
MLDHEFVTATDYLFSEKGFTIVAIESKRVDDIIERDLRLVPVIWLAMS